jgi:hypothetical protein
VNRRKIPSLPKDIDEFLRLSLRSPELAKFVYNDTPTGDREQNQQIKNKLNDGSGSPNQIKNAVLGGCSQPILGQQAEQPEGSHYKFQELFEKVI